MMHGYSDRVSHALAFAAKHATPRARSGAGATHLTHPAHVAVILARHGCDDETLVAGVLSILLNDTPPSTRAVLEGRVAGKFGAETAALVRQLSEPRYDARGKERSWEACKAEFLAGLADADPRALDACAANEIHVCGSLNTDVRRLGPEYLSGLAPGGAPAILRWYEGIVFALERHPVGPRPGMLAELRDLAGRLATAVSGD